MHLIAGFKVKINCQTKTEDDSLTTHLPNPKTNKNPKSQEPGALQVPADLQEQGRLPV